MAARITKFLVIFWLAFCHTASAETGFDFLGIKSRHWNCDAMMRAVNTLPKPVPCGWFDDDTFVDKTKRYDPNACRDRLLRSRKCSIARPHLAWTNHASLPAEVLIPRAKAVNALAAEHPYTSFVLSHICEHHLGAAQSQTLNSILRVHTPLLRHTFDSGLRGKDSTALPEVHSNKAQSVVVSQDGGTNGDGNGLLDVDVEQVKANGSFISFLWDKSFNCRINKDQRPPLQRTDCPNQDQFNHFIRLWYPKPTTPPGQQLTTKQIYKPSADNHGGCKGKDCKPVYITPTRQSRINITTLDGRSLGWLKYFGSYSGGGHRYYLANGSGQTAFQLGQQAEAISGSEFAVLNDGRNKFLFNPYRRGGLMR